MARHLKAGRLYIDSKHLPRFSDPEDMLAECMRYFDWVAATPLLEEKVFCQGDKIQRPEVRRMRAMSLEGMCIFLDTTKSTWGKYAKKPEYREVVQYVRDTLFAQKFEGAAAGMLNASIIARDLGLKDTVTNEHTGKEGGPIELIGSHMTVGEAAELYRKTTENEQ